MKKAFTLIEILIAVSVLAILSGVTLSVINSGAIQGRGRDSQRKADLQKVRTALELYYSDKKSYPVVSPAGKINPSLNTLTTSVPAYISALPTDPNPTTGTDYCTVRDYFYFSDGNTYTLYANMERTESVGTSTCGGSCTSSTTCYKLTNP